MPVDPGEVVVGVPLPDFGKYLMPVAGQSDLEPSGDVGTKVPVCMEPLTSNEYHISSRAPDEHWIITS